VKETNLLAVKHNYFG